MILWEGVPLNHLSLRGLVGFDIVGDKTMSKTLKSEENQSKISSKIDVEMLRCGSQPFVLVPRRGDEKVTTANLACGC